jgi:hypothetical protein
MRASHLVGLELWVMKPSYRVKGKTFSVDFQTLVAK